MLHLYQSNRLEYLAAMMAALHRAQPLSAPFAAEEIVVQSQGMRRYIGRFLADTHGIAANLRFSLPAGLNWRLMREHLPHLPELSPFAPEVMQWQLMRLFAAPEFAKDENYAPVRAALADYLHGGRTAAYRLAGQIADVFDQYLVYRPDWLQSWRRGATVAGVGAAQDWQMVLWQYVSQQGGGLPDRAELQARLMRALAQKNARLPERFCVFGIAALAPMYLQLLLQLSERSEVHIFALNPSAEYWGRVMAADAVLADGGDAVAHGHPLLAALGKQGRDFFDTLSDTPAATDLDVFDPAPVSGSLLHSLQHHIQTLTPPEEARPAWLAANGLSDAEAALAHLQTRDRSIQIHSAHSPLRELHVLKEHILRWLAENPSWQPHDIAVLTPHMETYAPFVEGVFGGGERPLPYSLSDVKRIRRQPLLHALAHTLELLPGRFETDRLLPLLDQPPVLRRFGLHADSLPLIRDTVARLNIRWGSDAAQRAEHGEHDALFTWQQGWERLALGWLLPEHAPLWQGISAHTANPAHTDIFSRFTALVRLLADTRREWQTPAAVPEWCARLRRLCENLLAPDSEDDHAAAQQFEQALCDWQAQAELAGFDGEIGVDTAAAHVKRFLGGTAEHGFLQGGITFCGMVPMRSLPFKAVCLLGLNDGDFPRTTKAAPFDLIAKHPRQGDRARRDDDRYLFLEAVLSAREILYLSYVGRHIRSDDALAPSVLLNELADSIAALTGIAAARLPEAWFVQHPLQPFSPRCFDGVSGSLQSSRSDYAAALNAPPVPPPPFFVRRRDAAAATPDDVAQQDFLRFWHNPLRGYLKHSLGWQPPRGERAWEAAEPFADEHPAALEQAFLEARKQNRSFHDTAAELRAQSLLPAGELGALLGRDYAARAAALNRELLHSPALPERGGRLATAHGTLHYRLNRLHRHGQILAPAHLPPDTAGRLPAAARVRLLLLHALYCAAAPEAGETHYLSLRQGVCLPPMAQSDAAETVSRWLAAYREGLHAPLPFFPRVSLRAAAARYGKDGATWEDDALPQALSLYHGGYQGFAEADYPEVKLVYGRDAEPPCLRPEFRDLTEYLFEPLQGCLKAWAEQENGVQAA